MPCAQGVSPSRLAQARQAAREGMARTHTRQDVEAAVSQAFSGAERAEALGYLGLHESTYEEPLLSRIQMAIVDLSEGKLDRLVRFADHAYHVDFRDILLWSESPTCRPIGMPAGL